MSRKFGSSPYCVGCRLRCEACVCAEAPRLSIVTRVLLLVHANEWRRIGNTGHLIRLALGNGTVRVHGRPGRILNDEGIDAESPSTLVLFPGCGGAPLTGDYLAPLAKPITLLVPDGNWGQTKRMLSRVPVLRRARPVRLERPRLSLPCVRHNEGTDRRSTFEAIAQALGAIEGRVVEDRMLDFFRLVLSRKNEYGISPVAHA
jgi:DTW domain-containing protein